MGIDVFWRLNGTFIRDYLLQDAVPLRAELLACKSQVKLCLYVFILVQLFDQELSVL